MGQCVTHRAHAADHQKGVDRPAAEGQCEAADERPSHEPEFGKPPEYQIVQCHRMTGPFGLLRGSFPVAVR
jgi:hypothetical protein